MQVTIEYDDLADIVMEKCNRLLEEYNLEVYITEEGDGFAIYGIREID